MLKMQLIVKEELMGRASDPHGDPVFNNHDLNMDVLYRTGHPYMYSPLSFNKHERFTPHVFYFNQGGDKPI
ncbi:hypothetical protein QN277_014238 [Acacia crassicarpa]|uniref:Uncharacterized protein n=1 Tax=Acacia crassicarpa TaxID=499986 RepID=A0AAE1TGL4_9FABA|nr:hypothetical protein QN277_014238 [Acacia crassicarpa]